MREITPSLRLRSRMKITDINENEETEIPIEQRQRLMNINEWKQEITTTDRWNHEEQLGTTTHKIALDTYQFIELIYNSRNQNNIIQ